MTYVVGNWKMHGRRQAAGALLRACADAASAAGPEVEVVVCPPAVWLTEAASIIAPSPLKLGGQDCHAQAEGAFTGDISAPMLREAGCDFVIVGHSERRAGHGETDAQVRAKAEAAIRAGLRPIICVGEPPAERAAGRAGAFVLAQAKASVPERLDASQFLLAYEPIWAIGSGRTPSAAEIEEIHGRLAAAFPGAPVLYGGSVKKTNALEILKIPGVGGVLVGGASLAAAEFGGIIAAASAQAPV